MSASSIEAEWRQLCAQIGRRARRAPQDEQNTLVPDQHADERVNEAREFVGQAAPSSYGELVSRIGSAEELLRKWQDQQVEAVQQEQLIDEAADDSFPASDPPPWGGAHA